MTAERIVVRSTNWVGDAVLTTPVYRVLRRNFPGARLVAIARPWVAGLLDGNPHLDEVIVEPDNRAASLWRTSRALRAGGPFDLGIALPNSLSAALTLWLGGVRQRVGYDLQLRRPLLTDPIALPPALLQQHQVEYYLYLLETVCEDFADARRLEVVLAEADRAAAASFVREAFDEDALAEGAPPLVGLAPGAAFGTAKRWPWERYAELAARLVREHGARIVLVGSKLEGEVAARILDWLRDNAPDAAPAVADSCGRLSLKGSAALLERCRVFVTNDSGAMHLAAALDVPQVAIFGPTDWVTTAPYSAAARIVRDPTECAPCLLRHCPIDHRCMTKIGVERVHAAVLERLAAVESGKFAA